VLDRYICSDLYKFLDS